MGSSSAPAGAFGQRHGDQRAAPLDTFDAVRYALIHDEANRPMREKGWEPLYTASADTRIAVIGQAPGIKAQTSGIPWDDASGRKLIEWLGVTEEQFRSPNLFAFLGMDFYYPGRGRSGDLPPRKGFAATWHPPLLALMPRIELVLLIGRYAQLHYLPSGRHRTLTDNVRDHRNFAPHWFPLVHPSPLNFRWQTRNPWFVTDVLPELKTRVRTAVGHAAAEE